MSKTETDEPHTHRRRWSMDPGPKTEFRRKLWACMKERQSLEKLLYDTLIKLKAVDNEMLELISTIQPMSMTVSVEHEHNHDQPGHVSTSSLGATEPRAAFRPNVHVEPSHTSQSSAPIDIVGAGRVDRTDSPKLPDVLASHTNSPKPSLFRRVFGNHSIARGSQTS